MAIYIGNGTAGNNADFSAGGWNFSVAAGATAVWGTSGNDKFYFANSTVAAGGGSNQAFVWNGAGGTDSIYFGTYMDGSLATSAFTFNINQLDTAATKYSLTGTTLSDKFQWTGAATATSTYTLNGGVGTDSLVLVGATDTTYTLANLTMSGMEFITGSAANDNVVWKSTGGYSFDLGNGTDTLNLTGSTTVADIRLENSTQFKNIEVLYGTSLNDVLGGSSAANETLYGGIGADSLWGNGGNDVLQGGAGSDVFFFGYGDGLDTIAKEGTVADAKSDRVYFQGAQGTAAFADLTFATSGENLVIGVKGTDSLTITDWASYATTATTINDNRLNKFVASDLTFGLALSNNTTSSLFGTDSTIAYFMQGGTAADTLKAGTTADSLKAGAGNDSLQYSTSAVLFDGEAGDDTLTAATSTAGVNIVLKDDTAKYKNIEYLLGSSLADKLGGTTAADTIDGGNNADSIWGAAGADTLIGGAGADTYWLGTGDGTDTITNAGADNKSDVVYFYNNSFNDLTFSLEAGNADVKIAVTGTDDAIYLTGAGTQMQAATQSFDRVNKFVTSDMTFGLTMGDGTGTMNLIGTSLSDYIVGSTGNDVIDGKKGFDAIYGKDGNDQIVFESTSWIDGGAGTDTISGAAASAGVAIEFGAAGNRVSNVEYLLGSAYADKLGGASANETLEGGAGADSLWGGAGDDSLVGGAGADSYWFGTGNGKDTIALDNGNYLDSVYFYGTGVGGGGITSTIVSGDNLTIGLSTGDSLTLLGWASGTSTQKLNKFYFEENGKTYSLAVDGSNVATWTQI